jgi:hypothetical protein
MCTFKKRAAKCSVEEARTIYSTLESSKKFAAEWIPVRTIFSVTWSLIAEERDSFLARISAGGTNSGLERITDVRIKPNNLIVGANLYQQKNCGPKTHFGVGLIQISIHASAY